MRDRSALRDEMTRVDGGIDMQVDVSCDFWGARIRTRLEAEPAFFAVSGLLRDVFFLAYGGMHWSYQDVLAMPIRRRQEFVEALERRLEFEKSELEKRSR